MRIFALVLALVLAGCDYEATVEQARESVLDHSHEFDDPENAGILAALAALEAEVKTLSVEVDALSSDLDSAEAEVDSLSSELETAEAEISALSTELAAVEGRVASAEGAIAQIDIAVDDAASALVSLDAALADTIELLTGTPTWSVTSGPELLAAIGDLDNYHLAYDALLTIEVAAGVHSVASALVINHPDGDRVQIVGATGDPADVELQFSGTSAVLVEDGSRLGYLNGVTLTQTGSANNTYGVRASRSSVAVVGPDVVIDGFGGGVAATGVSHVVAQNLDLTNNYTAGSAGGGSFLELGGSTMVADPVWSLDGVLCSANSTVVTSNASVTGYSRNGMSANTGGVINASGTTLSGNGTDTLLTGDVGFPSYIGL